jgi:hypothetical protein
VLIVHREEVEGSETHEMDILGPHASRVASPVWSTVSTGHGISNEAQSVVPQAEGVTSVCWCLIPRQLSFSVTGSDISEINIDQSRRRDAVSHFTNEWLTSTQFEGLHNVEGPPRAHFFMILEISMA